MNNNTKTNITYQITIYYKNHDNITKVLDKLKSPNPKNKQGDDVCVYGFHDLVMSVTHFNKDVKRIKPLRTIMKSNVSVQINTVDRCDNNSFPLITKYHYLTKFNVYDYQLTKDIVARHFKNDSSSFIQFEVNENMYSSIDKLVDEIFNNTK